MSGVVIMPNSVLSGEVTNNHKFDGLTVGTTFYRNVPVNNTPHFHENPTVCFLLQGGGVEKRKTGGYERSANDARFYYAEEPHQSDIRVFPSRCINLEFENDFLDRYGISENIINDAVGDNFEVKFAMLKMYREFLTNDLLAKPSIEMLLLGMLGRRTAVRPKKPIWIDTLRDILNDRWTENLTLEDLSFLLGVHPVTISKYFTRHFTCTLGEYVRKIKIEKSLSLIKGSKLSLTEISQVCGFADQSHFTRIFKKQTGFLPKDFKRL